MAQADALLYVGVWMAAWRFCALEDTAIPIPKNVHWVSLDFSTILKWTAATSDSKYTVVYSVEHDGTFGDWNDVLDCFEISHTECDMTEHITALNSAIEADIKTDYVDFSYDPEDTPHAFSPHFHPYMESNISAVGISVVNVDKRTVTVNITDPVTSLHSSGKQLNIRDIFGDDLQYKISYHKSGSTRKKDIISDTNLASIKDLDAGEVYCFSAAAFIPSRPKRTQMGAWSEQKCQDGDPSLSELTLEAWIGIFALIALLIVIIITVAVLCYRNRQRKRNQQTTLPVKYSQASK